MNVASQELCEKLYSLSGKVKSNWKDTEYRRYYDDGLFVTNEKLNGLWLPAYDLGYLLRKLQDNDLTIILRWNRDMGGRIAMKEWDGKWCIGTFDMPQGEYPVAATPEDAACKLAIQLFKKGILTKGGDEG
jgi:hypothetical protein